MSVTRVMGITSGMDTESIIKQYSSRYTAKKDKIWKQKQSLQYKEDAWKELNKDIYSLYTKLSTNRLSGTYQKSELTSSNEKVATVSGNKETNSQELTVNQIATQTFITGGEVDKKEPIGVNGNITVVVGGQHKDLNITPDMSMEQVARKLSEAGIAASFDENNMRLFLSSQKTGKDSEFDIIGDAGVLAALGLGSAATKTNGQDAMITLNGVQFKSNNNHFDINGYSIEANSVGSTTIKTKTDDKIFDTIKDFIETYNTLIKKIDTAYNASNKGYKPLTDEEKEVLSEKQVDEWEKVLKDSALYKDSSLYEISNVLKNTMSTTSVDGMRLSTIGINLGNYFTTDKNERGVYTIDEDKLKEAINKDPNKVTNFITKLSAKLYDNIDKKMKSTSYSSVYTVYNDKQIKADIEDYDKKIKEWEKKIEQIEDKYYKQFAKMETLLSSTQSKSNYFASYFGM